MLLGIKEDKELKKRQRGLRSAKKGYPSRRLFWMRLDYQLESILKKEKSNLRERLKRMT